jgi:DnaK suppressor protein
LRDAPKPEHRQEMTMESRRKGEWDETRSRLEAMLTLLEEGARQVMMVAGSDASVDGDGSVSVDANAYVMRHIREALQRIQDGDYGWCKECGDAIPRVRLQAVPFAARCIGCQQVEELSASVLRGDGVPRWAGGAPRWPE